MRNKRVKVKAVMAALMCLSFMLTGCDRLMGTLEGFFPDKREGTGKRVVYAMPVAGEAMIMTGERGETEPVKGTITVAAIGSPNTEILEEAERILKQKGYDLKIDICDDYQAPNEKLANQTVDCNFYQHAAFLERYNMEKGTSLVEEARIYYQPMAIYSGVESDLSNLKKGARILVPADTTGFARAMLLLDQEGLLTLVSDADLRTIEDDIEENPLELTFTSMEEGLIMENRNQADIVICQTGYALAAGLEPRKEALAVEDKESLGISWLSQALVVRQQGEEKIGPLLEVLVSEEMQEFILNKYQGSLYPLGEVMPENHDQPSQEGENVEESNEESS